MKNRNDCRVYLPRLAGILGVMSLILATLGPRAFAQASDRALAQEEMEQIRASRLTNARSTTLVSPYYSVLGSKSVVLYILNNFSDRIDVTMNVVSPNGQEIGLGIISIEPTTFEAVNLGELLGSIVPSFPQGSIELTFFGDQEMLQAWQVLKDQGQILEWAFLGPSLLTARKLTSFWDLRNRSQSSSAGPKIHLFNRSATETFFSARFTNAGNEVVEIVGSVLPRSIRQIVPAGLSELFDHGSIEITHDGEPEEVAILGYLEDGKIFDTMSFLRPSDLEERTSLQTLPIDLEPVSSHQESRAVLYLTLFNPLDRPQQAEVEVVAADSGSSIFMVLQTLQPKQVWSADLSDIVPDLGFQEPTANRVSVLEEGKLANEVRLRVSGQLLSIEASARLKRSDGTVQSVPFFRTTSAHQNGSYPLPDLQSSAVTNTMTNLGNEVADIVAQVFWEGGTYALAPFKILPGQSHRIDLGRLIAEGKADLAGRTLSSPSSGFLQWTARNGSHQIISRTEVRLLDGTGRFGFNCVSCCPESSFGEISPSSIAFDIGQSPFFEGFEYISTCTTTLGPFPASFLSLSYRSPVAWNGVRVSSTGDTFQQLSFTARGERTRLSQGICRSVNTQIGDTGSTTVDRCRRRHHPGYDPRDGCQLQTSSCSSCYDCCDKEKAVGNCQCPFFGNAICKAGVRLQCQTCKDACFGRYAETSGCSTTTRTCN